MFLINAQCLQAKKLAGARNRTHHRESVMSLPLHHPDGAVPQIAPELASEENEAMEEARADEETDMEKARQFCQLSERRVMETKQELDRIEQMGKVSGFCLGCTE